MRIRCREADRCWPSLYRVCGAESVVRGCIENYLFATEYSGINERSIMRAQDVLIIPFQLSWQELGSKLEWSRHWYWSFYYHCPCDQQILLLYCSSWFSKGRSKLRYCFYRLCWGQILQNNFCKVNFYFLNCWGFFYPYLRFLFWFTFFGWLVGDFLSLYLFCLARKLKTLGSSVFWRS